MDKAGQSILWFLGACLLFSETLVAGVAKAYTDVEGSWVLLFGFLCLTIVIVALLVMFITNPAFIIAERGDLVSLTLIQQLARDNHPDLFKRIMNLKPELWTSGEPGVDDAEAQAPVESIPEAETDESPDDTDVDEDFAKALAALKSS